MIPLTVEFSKVDVGTSGRINIALLNRRILGQQSECLSVAQKLRNRISESKHGQSTVGKCGIWKFEDGDVEQGERTTILISKHRECTFGLVNGSLKG